MANNGGSSSMYGKGSCEIRCERSNLPADSRAPIIISLIVTS